MSLVVLPLFTKVRVIVCLAWLIAKPAHLQQLALVASLDSFSHQGSVRFAQPCRVIS